MSMVTAVPEISQLEFQKLDVLERLAKIETMLTGTDPMMPVHLKHIHQTLQRYEELVHVLGDKEISVLMAGMQRYRGIQLTKEIANKKRVTLKGTTVDDL